MRLSLLAVFVAAIFPTVATAADPWLIADSNSVNDGDMLWLSFVAGEVFPYGNLTTDEVCVAAFVDCDANGVRDITGYAPQDRGLSIREPITGSGTHVIGCSLKPRLIELDTDAFEAYLRSQRAERAMSIWDQQKRPQSSESATDMPCSKPIPHLSPVLPSVRTCETDDRDDGPVVERYTDFAKTIVEVQPSDPEDTGYEILLGHRLEIIPMSHPCHWRVGLTVQVKVSLDGYPWPYVPVSAGHEGLGLDEPVYVCQTTTDADGVAFVPLTRAGHWFIKAHLIRPTNGLGKARWESLRASLTFRVLGETDVGRALLAIRAVHGRLDPWAVAGYRMGQRAMKELALPYGSPDLLAVHWALFESQSEIQAPESEIGNQQYAALTDGVQAATGVNTDSPDLALADGPAADLQTVFTSRATGGAVAIQLKDDFIRMISGTPRDELKSAALKASILSDEEMFTIAPASEALLAPVVFEQLTGVAPSEGQAPPASWGPR